MAGDGYPQAVQDAVRVIRENGYYASLKKRETHEDIVRCICGRRFPRTERVSGLIEIRCPRCDLFTSAQTKSQAVREWNSIQNRIQLSDERCRFYHFDDIMNVLSDVIYHLDRDRVDSICLHRYRNEMRNYLQGPFSFRHLSGYGLRSIFMIDNASERAVQICIDLDGRNESHFSELQEILHCSGEDVQVMREITSEVKRRLLDSNLDREWPTRK